MHPSLRFAAEAGNGSAGWLRPRRDGRAAEWTTQTGAASFAQSTASLARAAIPGWLRGKNKSPGVSSRRSGGPGTSRIEPVGGTKVESA